MAVDSLVDSTALDSNLTAIANAIRTKGGTSASLAFPNGFIGAVQAIQTGGTEFIMTVSWNASVSKWMPDCTMAELWQASQDGKSIAVCSDVSAENVAVDGFWADDELYVYFVRERANTSSIDGIREICYVFSNSGVSVHSDEMFIQPTGSLAITQNANGIDVSNVATVNVNVPTSGGASNIVQGTFTTGSTRASTGSFTIPYTGSGYPILLMVQIKGGVYNNSTGGDTAWYNATNRYDVGWACLTKSQMTTSPTYATSGSQNYGTIAYIYKNSTSTGTSYTRSSSMTANSYTASSQNGATGANCIRWKGNGKTVGYYIGNQSSSTVGLHPSQEYEYIAIYSS